MKSVFVSYDYNNLSEAQKVKAWGEGGRLGMLVVTRESSDVRQGGAAAIRAHIEPKIRGCAVVLCLVGQDSHNRRWVDYEVALAKSLNKPVVCVRLPATTGAAPVEVRNQSMVVFEPGAIRDALAVV